MYQKTTLTDWSIIIVCFCFVLLMLCALAAFVVQTKFSYNLVFASLALLVVGSMVASIFYYIDDSRRLF